jgi:hypothetical protein
MNKNLRDGTTQQKDGEAQGGNLAGMYGGGKYGRGK